MVTLLNLRQLYGDVVETATIVRSLLAPVASQLSGDPSNLHRRCLLGQYLGPFCHPDGVRDDLEPFGAIEAVAVCELHYTAVIVFRAEACVAVALRRQGETWYGCYSEVPPLDAALPLRCFPLNRIKAELYPPTPEDAVRTLAPPRRRRPIFCFRNSPHEPAMIPFRGDAGTTWFWPSTNARVYGPVLGADGHLWMDGENILYYEESVGGRIDPSWVRVAPLDPPGEYGGGPATFVPLYGVTPSLL